MKAQLNEVKKLQKIAGLLNEGFDDDVINSIKEILAPLPLEIKKFYNSPDSQEVRRQFQGTDNITADAVANAVIVAYVNKEMATKK